MPCEILRRRYFGLPKVEAIEGPSRLEIILDPGEETDEPADPLVYNFLHDLEASFWTGLWIVTSRVNHEPSRIYALSIFQNTPTLELSTRRLATFEQPIKARLQACLPDLLKPLAGTFNVI